MVKDVTSLLTMDLTILLTIVAKRVALTFEYKDK